mmetsp:Transcript_26174/g.36902  ORF Transcript_26174/g.36902 Transcript_26174/m.36902 type:complete len:176 (-) Transcript_26174:135-662(-)
MAPEVAMGKPYNAKGDIYSFSLIAYQIMSLQAKIFNNFTISKMMDQVVKQGKRPLFPLSSRTWPDSICLLIKAGWMSDFRERPTAKAMHHTLKHVLRNEESKISSLSLPPPAVKGGSKHDAKLSKTEQKPPKSWTDLCLSIRAESRRLYKEAAQSKADEGSKILILKKSRTKIRC